MNDKSCIGEGATHCACSCALERMAKFEAVTKAAIALVVQFKAIQEDHYENLVHHQSFESASANWEGIKQGPLEFGPLLAAIDEMSLSDEMEAVGLVGELLKRMRLINGDDRSCCMDSKVCPNHALMARAEMFLFLHRGPL